MMFLRLSAIFVTQIWQVASASAPESRTHADTCSSDDHRSGGCGGVSDARETAEEAEVHAMSVEMLQSATKIRRHRQQRSETHHGSTPNGWTSGANASRLQSSTIPGVCAYGTILDVESDTCAPPELGQQMTFYLYRAQSSFTPPTNEGLNLANLDGVMWYLHNEVVRVCEVGDVRHYNISRIIRYKITMKPTEALIASTKNFDIFLQFDSARCTNPICAERFETCGGYYVGCQILPSSVAAYTNPDPAWFSFPGQCPFKDFTEKDAACRAAEPGGECPNPDGSETCTFHLEEAGEISLDELTGREPGTPCTHPEENDPWWSGKTDPARCEERIDQVRNMFKEKYPDMPLSYGEPCCDVDGPHGPCRQYNHYV